MCEHVSCWNSAGDLTSVQRVALKVERRGRSACYENRIKTRKGSKLYCGMPRDSLEALRLQHEANNH
jgi:hypothetical protein